MLIFKNAKIAEATFDDYHHNHSIVLQIHINKLTTRKFCTIK